MADRLALFVVLLLPITFISLAWVAQSPAITPLPPQSNGTYASALYAQSVNYSDIKPLLGGLGSRYVVYKTDDAVWHSFSMAKTFGTNNTLVMERYPEDLQVGDIIGVEYGAYGVTHRIVAMNGSCIYTQGDAVPFPDGTCWNASDVVYRVVGVFYTR